MNGCVDMAECVNKRECVGVLQSVSIRGCVLVCYRVCRQE